MEEILRHVGKAERQQQMDSTVYTIDPEKVFTMESDSQVHNDSTDKFRCLLADIRANGEIDHVKALNYYVNFRSLRHDSWVDYLKKNCQTRNADFGDVLVLDYLSSNGFLKVHEYNVLNTVPVTDEQQREFYESKTKFCKDNELLEYKYMRLTPDILFRANNTTYIGDVTVTKDEGNAKIWKHDKYKPIVNWLKKQDEDVTHVDFILREDLHNLSSLSQDFCDRGIIYSTLESKLVYEHYHQSITASMDLAFDSCNDKQALATSLRINDRKEAPLPQLNLDYPHVPITDYVPTQSEDELIAMLKKHVDTFDVATHYDTGIESSVKAFQTIRDNNLAKGNFMLPKETLKVIDNSEYRENLTGNNLIMDYSADAAECEGNDSAKNLLMHLLPTPSQIRMMDEIKKDGLKPAMVKKTEKYSKARVYGNGYFEPVETIDDPAVWKLKKHLLNGKDNPNEKKEVLQVNPESYDDAVWFINNSMNYYGQRSNKAPFLDDSWDARTGLEQQESKATREMYDFVRETNGAQLCHAMSQLYNKIIHTSTYLGGKTIVYVPPNGSFIAIIPSSHCPVNRASCDLPFIFITRSWKDVVLDHIEYQYTVCSKTHRYYISKLCRLNLNKVANWNNAGYQLVSSASYMLSIAPSLQVVKEKYVGLLTYMILDCHQKTSEFLDLLKYVSFMPFSEIHKLPELIKDKFNLLIKTKLDAWMFTHMESFVVELAKVDKLKPLKPKVQIINNRLMTDCLGLDIKLPTFVEPSVRHTSCISYIEEISMIYASRPKHLYGSQFMDKAMTSICEWNEQYEESIVEHGSWVIDGTGVGPYPFKCNFAFSSDAIYYASQAARKENALPNDHIWSEILKGDMFNFIHYNCTLRGCTKKHGDRDNHHDLHSTSIDECLKYYKSKGYEDKECTVVRCAQETLRKEKHIMQFTKSEKEQRGSGRPIATPTLEDKVLLMCVEKPEVPKGKRVSNNIIVPGKNKLKEQADTYKKVIVEGTIKRFKYCAQITEDQTKFSEMDNTRKYKTYLRCDKSAPPEVRQMQYDVITMLENREHLIKRMPERIKECHTKWINEDNNGVKAIIGWPQGMLNFISTSMHSDADIWITKAYNKAYPNNQVFTKGLVHSDDSCVFICYNDEEDFIRFCIFRTEAKRLFCLKLNIKKLWASIFFGEIVSHYNMNGNVHLSVAKTIANSFSNLTFLNWPTDVSNQVSTIQQCYRNGATVPTLIMMNTILKQQLVSTYQVKGFQKQYLHLLPVDLGGYPDNSAFELGVTGITCHYKRLINRYEKPSNIQVSSAVRFCLERSKQMMKNDSTKIRQIIVTDDWNDLNDEDTTMRKLTSSDFENVMMPSKGDIFACIKHLMPKSTKIKQTVDNIRSLPFEPSGLELIVTRPETLAEALGNLQAQTSNMFYQLASENYTQSSKRMAMSQTMQSSGRVVCLDGCLPMTYNELLETLFMNSESIALDTELISTAFSDDNELVELCENVVNNSENYITVTDRRKVLNRMPTVEDKFKTIAPLKDVLIYIIQTNYCYQNARKPKDTLSSTHKIWTNLYSIYGTKKASLETVIEDADRIKHRFSDFFSFYTTPAACSLIMRQFMSSIQSRLWVQPNLRHDTLQGFIETLYGKTISNDKNYVMSIRLGAKPKDSAVKNWVRTLYTTEVLNRVYENKFRISYVDTDLGRFHEVKNVLQRLDPSTLDDDYQLKFAMLNYVHSGNDDMLRRAVANKRYAQHWARKQVWNNGSYSGPFSILVRYSGIVVRISGTPGNVEVESSSDEIHKVLMAMRLMVAENFKKYGYSNPGDWARSGFYNTDGIHSNYLVHYSSVNTQIRINPPDNVKKVHFRLNTSLASAMPRTVEVSGVFEFDPGFRIISINNGNKSYRVDSVFQDLGLPYSRHIGISPDFIDNICNQDLYRTGVILDLTLMRHYNVTKSSIMECLRPSGNYSCLPMIRMYYNCILKQSKLEPMEEEYDVSPELVEVYELTGHTADDIIEIGMTTKVDELNPDAITFNAPITFTRVGGIKAHKDITRLLASMYIGTPSRLELHDFIRKMCNDRYIGRHMYQESVENRGYDDVAITFQEATEMTNAETIDDDLYCFIKATKLDLPSTWRTLEVDAIRLSKTYSNYNIAKRRVDALKVCISEHVDEAVEEDTDWVGKMGEL